MPGRPRSGGVERGISPINTLKGRRTAPVKHPAQRQGCDLHEQFTRVWSVIPVGGKESPQTHERIGDARPPKNVRAVGPRGLVIRCGSSRIGCTAMCPATLQEAKPKAGSLRDLVDRAADRRRESKPRSRSQINPRSTAFLIHTCFQPAAGRPDENKSGCGRSGANGTWARSDRNVANAI